MTTKQLDNLLFAQGGKCFFCKETLDRGNASVEHLVAKANGGNNSNNENCVACCKAVNSLLGSLPLKHKIEIILNQEGRFICPSKKSAPAVVKQAEKTVPVKLPVKQAIKKAPAKKTLSPIDQADERLNDAIDNLKKRGNARPKKLKTLKTTLASIIKFKGLTSSEIDAIIDRLCKAGKIVVNAESVAYKL
jgi:hypothetical protein